MKRFNMAFFLLLSTLASADETITPEKLRGVLLDAIEASESLDYGKLDSKSSQVYGERCTIEFSPFDKDVFSIRGSTNIVKSAILPSKHAKIFIQKGGNSASPSTTYFFRQPDDTFFTSLTIRTFSDIASFEVLMNKGGFSPAVSCYFSE